MKESKGYQIQIVGNLGTVKRMVAAIFLVNSKNKEQTLKISVCDDLPHVIIPAHEKLRNSPYHELIESGLMLHVAHGRRLTIRANLLDNNGLCVAKPTEEIILSSEAVWQSNASFTVDFNLELQRPHESASIQISITSKDNFDSDIPLSVLPRINVMWHPKDAGGVQSIRKTWEANDSNTLPHTKFQTRRVSETLPHFYLPKYQEIEYIGQSRTSDKPKYGNYTSSQQLSPRNTNDVKQFPVKDKRGNVISSTVPSEADPLPQWAKGYGDQYDYDDVVVV